MSWRAFSEGIAQAKLKSAVLHVVSIQEEVQASFSASDVLAAEKTNRESLERVQIKARMEAEANQVTILTDISIGHSVAAMVDYVKKNKINMLIIGETGHSSIWGTLLGTTAERIVRDAPCSVLIVR